MEEGDVFIKIFIVKWLFIIVIEGVGVKKVISDIFRFVVSDIFIELGCVKFNYVE